MMTLSQHGGGGVVGSGWGPRAGLSPIDFEGELPGGPLEGLLPMRETPIILAAYHGILTGDNRPTWPWELQLWCMRYAPHVLVIAQQYWTWPFPRLNWWRNLHLGASLAARLQMYADAGCEIHMVGHSNGACILSSALRRLHGRGVQVQSLLSIGGAIPSEVRRSPIYAAAADGLLLRAESWWCATDPVFRRRALGVLQGALTWPYGRNGGTGWMRDGEPYASPSITSVEHSGMGHTGYFSQANRLETFRRIVDYVEDQRWK